MRIAVINGDFVENVIEIDEGSDFTLPGRALVDAGDAAPGWRLIEGDLVAPSAPAVDVSAYRKQALETAMAYGNAITQSEIGQWAGIEPLSWTQQRDEAKIVRDGGTLGEDAVLPGSLSTRASRLPSMRTTYGRTPCAIRRFCEQRFSFGERRRTS